MIVRLITTRNSVYVFMTLPNTNLARLVCVSGTFAGKQFVVSQLRSDVPHVGEPWRASVQMPAKDVFDYLILSEIVSIEFAESGV